MTLGKNTQMFINRVREIANLEKVLPYRGAHLLVIYGRRRVGKTELLRHFFRDRPHVFFFGTESNSSIQVADLASRVGHLWDDGFLRNSPPSEWYSLFQYLSGQNKPLDLILDEFPALCGVDPALPSLLQRYWDESGRNRQVRIALCGSSISFMENEVLSERSPLFGRRTAQMHLKPMDVWDIEGFLPGVDFERRVEFFACFGGVPHYLVRLASDRPLLENLRELVLDPVAYLYEEPRLLLSQELREPGVYFSLLRSLAAGRTGLNDICQLAGVSSSVGSRYIDTLIRLQLVERSVPVTELAHRSRKGLYRICDPFLRFWFRYVFPNYSDLEYGRSREVCLEKIAPELNSFVAPVFEEICREWLRRHPERCPFTPQRVGGWWDRAHEVDIVAFNETDVLFGECKWSDQFAPAAAWQQLMSNSSAVPGFESHRKHYALFCKQKPQEAASTDWLIFGLEDLFGLSS